ncbi:hypothetical protein QYM36_008707 [Artemia franciscana]|uniref:HAT C-terminal dimerisation domain-containing protein n=1 Tax=Artemia franciscana TaxID=6661 RepID=A0AA88I0X7_ARTSF|nr:hypothetical protein QYM36_008707 [Artemia franciscana]
MWKKKTITSTAIQVEYTYPNNLNSIEQVSIPQQTLPNHEEKFEPISQITVKKEENGYECEVVPNAIYEPQDLLGAAFDNADLTARVLQPVAASSNDIVLYRRTDATEMPHQMKTTEVSLSVRIANAEMKEALVKYISTDLMPPMWLDSQGFQKFAQRLLNIGATYGKLEIGQIMPDVATVTERLSQQARYARSQIQETIQCDNPAQFAVSVETWRNDVGQQYATITIHYIAENFVLKKYRLDSIQAEDETVEVQIRNILDAYNLGQPKCITVEPCHEHCYTTSDSILCSVALLNGVASSVFESEADYLPAKLFLSCNIILAHAQNSERAIKYRSYLPSYEKRSDWASKCQFLSAVANAWDTLLGISGEVDGLPTLMLEVDVTQLRCVISVLQPFQDALGLLSIQNEPTLHFVVPIVRKLETHLQPSSDDNDDIKHIKSQLLNHFMKVKDKLLSKMACCALFFDPSKKSLRITDDNDREIARDTIFTEMRLIDSELCLEMPLEKIKKFDLEEFSDFDHTFKDPVTAEFERYIYFQISQQGEGLTTSVLEWWKNNKINFPRLAQLAHAYLAIPTIANPSAYGESILERRRFLDSESTSDILILNASAHIGGS